MKNNWMENFHFFKSVNQFGVSQSTLLRYGVPTGTQKPPTPINYYLSNITFTRACPEYEILRVLNKYLVFNKPIKIKL